MNTVVVCDFEALNQEAAFNQKNNSFYGVFIVKKN